MMYLQCFTTLLLALFFPLMLTVNRTAGILQGLLVLIALGCLLLNRHRSDITSSFGATLRQYWPLHLAMASPVIAIVIHGVFAGPLLGRDIDYPFRLALFPLILWLVLQIPLPMLKQVRWGFALAAIAGTIKIIILSDNGANRYGTDFIPIIVFSLWVLLISLFSIYATIWDNAPKKWSIPLSLICAFCGLYTIFISQSRGVWVTLPFLFVIGVYAAKQLPRWYKTGLIVFAALLVVGASMFTHTVQVRIADAHSDLQDYARNPQSDTSLGQRLQLWRASWGLFKEHPVIGVGVTDFRDTLSDLADRQIISRQASDHPHSHHEILFMMAQLGIFGLISLLSLYLIPAWYFMRDIRHQDATIRAIAAAGLSLCVGIFILGLSDVVLVWRESLPFYAISIAGFLGLTAKRKQQLTQIH